MKSRTAQFVELIALIHRTNHPLSRFNFDCEVCESFYRLAYTLPYRDLLQAFAAARRNHGELSFLSSLYYVD